MNHYQALTTFILIIKYADNVTTAIHVKYLYAYLISLFPSYAFLHNITI